DDIFASQDEQVTTHEDNIISEGGLDKNPSTSTQDYVSKKNDASIIFQDLNHINFFDNEYSEVPNDNERVNPNLNSNYMSQSDSNHSSMLGGGVDTAVFLSNNSGNDADSSDDIFASQDEQ
nr:hypothetical protein [Tanacetum cinerariifolium]